VLNFASLTAKFCQTLSANCPIYDPKKLLILSMQKSHALMKLKPRSQFHQTLFSKQKVANAQGLAKNSPIDFTNIQTALMKFANLMRSLPKLFTVCQTLFAKKLLILRPQKTLSREC